MFGQWFGTTYAGSWFGGEEPELPPIPPDEPPIYGGRDYGRDLRNARLALRRQQLLAEDEMILSIILAWLEMREVSS